MADVKPYLVRADLIGFRIVTGTIEEGVIQPYEAAPGDQIDTKWGTIRRDGKEYGTLVERPDGYNYVTPFDRFDADPSELFFTGGSADLTVSYTVRINGTEAQIDAVWRKTKIIDTAQIGRWTRDFITQHDLVIEIDSDVRTGDEVDIVLSDPHLAPISFTFDDNRMFSEAIHVVQTGFEADDPVKVAYLSTWLGDRGEAPGSDGAVEYDVGHTFTVRDVTTDQVVFTGEIELDKALGEPSNHVLNFNKTDVFKLDFSGFNTSGDYYVQVDGIGRSFAFEIADNAWIEPFQTAMLGFYHQRSGIELGPQFTDWVRPRSLHPDDGIVVRQSSATLMDTSMGLNLQGENSFEALVAGATEEVVQDAWGGWHDAGDWDRRAQHLEISRDFLELAEARPTFARSVELSLPEADNGIPDLIDEALWNLDFYMRLQKPDGGVPGGVESAGHPKYGVPSWFESHDVFVYAPDAWASFEYAATAARAARVVAEYDPARAAAYEDSAVAAMRWAESNLPNYAEDNATVNNARNLAAVELYRLTGEADWHDLFLATTSYNGGRIAWNEHQFDAVLVYDAAARHGLVTDEIVLSLGQQDLVDFADFLTTTGDRGAFGQIINPNTPIGYGYTSAVPADAANVLVKAHMLTGNEDYFAAILSDTLFGLGANPDNLVFTTGLGDRPVEKALVVDGLILGEMPAGITLFGMWNVGDRGRHGTFAEIDAHTFPIMSQSSPVHETFNADIRAVPLTEYAIHSTMGPTAYVWGYLAATDP